MADYRLYPATSGPSSAASDSTSYTMGVEFYVTSAANLTGYWWWCAIGASTAPQVHQLWQVATGTTGSAVGGTTVTSGTRTQGQWNFTALSPPVALTPNQRYRASVTDSSGADWYSATPAGFPVDIVNGPLTAPSTVNATGGIQMGYVISSVPTFPELTTGGNYWMDVQVSDPGGSTTATAGLAAVSVAAAGAVPGLGSLPSAAAVAVAAYPVVSGSAVTATAGLATIAGTAHGGTAAIVVAAGAAGVSVSAHPGSVPVGPSAYALFIGGREPGTATGGNEPFTPAP